VAEVGCNADAEGAAAILDERTLFFNFFLPPPLTAVLLFFASREAAGTTPSTNPAFTTISPATPLFLTFRLKYVPYSSSSSPTPTPLDNFLIFLSVLVDHLPPPVAEEEDPPSFFFVAPPPVPHRKVWKPFLGLLGG
jgi:hypothetical protein